MKSYIFIKKINKTLTVTLYIGQAVWGMDGWIYGYKIKNLSGSIKLFMQSGKVVHIFRLECTSPLLKSEQIIKH